MKRFVIFFSLFLILTSFEEQPNCNKLHTGKFKIYSKTYGNYVITRTPTKQLEFNEKTKSSMQYDVVWVNNCTYELRNAKVLSGDRRLQGKATDIIKVEIIQVSKKSYLARTSSNFNDAIMESEVEILK